MTALSGVCALAGLDGCAEASGSLGDEEIEVQGPNTFEEWKQGLVHVEDPEAYIVDHDILLSEADLHEYFAEHNNANALSALRNDGEDAIRSPTERMNLTYCVSTDFGTRRQSVIDALSQAAAEWEAVVDLDFRRVSVSESRCDGTDPSTVFAVHYDSSSTGYVGAAPLPWSTGKRVVRVTRLAFESQWNLKSVFLHELGHVLGLAHEHARPENGLCPDGHTQRSVTPFDRPSIMHYPSWSETRDCNGASSWGSLTYLDKQGLICLYEGICEWERVPGLARDIAAGDGGNVWIIGTNATPGGYTIHHWNGTGWTTVSGGAVRIAVDGDGVPWVINKNNDIFRRNANGSWTQISGKARDIGASEGGVCIIGMGAEPGGFGIYCLNDGWRKIPGGAVRIAVDRNGLPWVVNSDGGVFQRLSSNVWSTLGGDALDIGIGYTTGYWGYLAWKALITGGPTFASSSGVQSWNASTNRWDDRTGTAVSVTVERGSGTGWIINSSGTIYRQRW